MIGPGTIYEQIQELGIASKIGNDGTDEIGSSQPRIDHDNGTWEIHGNPLITQKYAFKWENHLQILALGILTVQAIGVAWKIPKLYGGLLVQQPNITMHNCPFIDLHRFTSLENISHSYIGLPQGSHAQVITSCHGTQWNYTYIYKLVKHGQTCSNIGYPQTGCLILKNTRHDDHLWMQRP